MADNCGAYCLWIPHLRRFKCGELISSTEMHRNAYKCDMRPKFDCSSVGTDSIKLPQILNQPASTSRSTINEVLHHRGHLNKFQQLQGQAIRGKMWQASRGCVHPLCCGLTPPSFSSFLPALMASYDLILQGDDI